MSMSVPVTVALLALLALTNAQSAAISQRSSVSSGTEVFVGASDPNVWTVGRFLTNPGTWNYVLGLTLSP